MGRRPLERDLDPRIVNAYIRNGLCAKDIALRTGFTATSIKAFVKRNMPVMNIMLYDNGVRARRERGGPKSGAGTAGKKRV